MGGRATLTAQDHGYITVVADSIVPGSESAIFRGEIAKLIGENMDVREALVLASSGSYAKDRKIAALEATIADIVAMHADEIARLKARYEAEAAGISALAERRKERIGELENRNDELAERQVSQRAPLPVVDELVDVGAAQESGRRQEERQAVRMEAARPERRASRRDAKDGHQHARRVPLPGPVRQVRRRRHLYDWDTVVKQCAEVLRVVTARRSIVLVDVFCGACGAKTSVSHAGTVRDTSLGPYALALLWIIWSETHCGAAALPELVDSILGIKMSRATAANAIDAANDILDPMADAIRAEMDTMREYGEIDEGVRKMMVEAVAGGLADGDAEGGGSAAGGGGGGGTAAIGTPPAAAAASAQEGPGDGCRCGGLGCGGWPGASTSPDSDDGLSPDPSRPQRRVRRGYIHAASYMRRVAMWAVPTRNADAFRNYFRDRLGAGTATDGLSVYNHSNPHQRDHAHELRETEAAAAAGDPAAAALHERFGAALFAVRKYSDRPGGAFPDPGAQDRYDEFVPG